MLNELLTSINQFYHANPILLIVSYVVVFSARHALRYLGYTVTRMILLPITILSIRVERCLERFPNKRDV